MKAPIILISSLAVLPFMTACGDNCCKPVPAENAVVAEAVVPAEKLQNPFLQEGYAIRWSALTPENIVPDTQIAIARAQKAIDKICALTPEQLTYDNVVGVYWNEFMAPFDFFSSLLAHVKDVCMTAEYNAEYEKALPLIAEFGTSVDLNPKLWEIFKAYAGTEDAKNLSPQKKRYLDKIINGFRDGGADLPADKKEELKEISKELTTLRQNFSRNVLDSINAYSLLVTDPARLAGLPETERAAALEEAKKAGKASDEKPAWMFTLRAPSYSPAVKYLDDAALRKELWAAANAQCIGGEFDNTKITRRILELRQKRAEILGEKNFSDLILKRRMAKNGETAYNFVLELQGKTKAAFLREYEELKAFRKSQDATYDGGNFEPWDVAYWSEKMRKAKYDFDSNSVKPYFSMENVMDGMFRFFEELHGLRIREVPSAFVELGSGKSVPAGTVEVWHPEVKFYELFDAETNARIGVFYTDWYPRASKRSGAWMHPLAVGDRKAGIPNFGLVCGNMTAPVGNEPALLTHYDVETIYHEFGHLLHHLLGNTEVPALNGTSVAWDFVEFPSQLNENWTWEPSVLKRFAKHYKTGEVIPQSIIDGMLRARNFQAAYAQMRQLSFAGSDLYIHRNAKAIAGREVNDVGMELARDYSWPMKTQSNTILNRLTHIFSGGYSSGYYSYKWAEALEADAYLSFKNPDGSINFGKGKEYRKKILERGDTVDANELFRDFVGREPDWNAINVLHGISEK